LEAVNYDFEMEVDKLTTIIAQMDEEMK